MGESLLVEHLGAVARLTLNDPPFNRMSLNFMDELEQQVVDIADNSEIRSVLLTSAGEENFARFDLADWLTSLTVQGAFLLPRSWRRMQTLKTLKEILMNS